MSTAKLLNFNIICYIQKKKRTKLITEKNCEQLFTKKKKTNKTMWNYLLFRKLSNLQNTLWFNTINILECSVMQKVIFPQVFSSVCGQVGVTLLLLWWSIMGLIGAYLPQISLLIVREQVAIRTCSLVSWSCWRFRTPLSFPLPMMVVNDRGYESELYYKYLNPGDLVHCLWVQRIDC